MTAARECGACGGNGEYEGLFFFVFSLQTHRERHVARA